MSLPRPPTVAFSIAVAGWLIAVLGWLAATFFLSDQLIRQEDVTFSPRGLLQAGALGLGFFVSMFAVVFAAVIAEHHAGEWKVRAALWLGGAYCLIGAILYMAPTLGS